ncbi:hypothetical protein PUMCH_002689 [Australozyma saopauloensis]|uniref:37S ribosomal protein S28, mitochondrial n=1 Tax=Australozyma saopauloensis TaxID=291208 RepID=A0AAX4HBV4_9ASCO|nr:hypothetical protein PUMCH_002689 [[Candida] saopauloensis]
MFRIPQRFFGTTCPRLSAETTSTVSRASYPVKLALKQFFPQDATRLKKRALRRRELRLKSQIIRDVNNLKQHRIKNSPYLVDPVLGSAECTFIKSMKEVLEEPNALAFGYDRVEFEKLMYGAQKAALDATIGGETVTEKVISTEEKKKRALMTILHNKNSSNEDKRKRAIAFARQEFQRFDGDTGSPEVQAAVSTVKIHWNMRNIIDAFKDKERIQRVRQMVQGRQKMLKYLKRNNPERYYYAIEKLGLTDDVVCNEFSMSKAYMDEYEVFGDRKQLRVTPTMKRRREKIADLERRVEEYHRVARENYAKINGTA